MTWMQIHNKNTGLMREGGGEGRGGGGEGRGGGGEEKKRKRETENRDSLSCFTATHEAAAVSFLHG